MHFNIYTVYLFTLLHDHITCILLLKHMMVLYLLASYCQQNLLNLFQGQFYLVTSRPNLIPPLSMSWNHMFITKNNFFKGFHKNFLDCHISPGSWLSNVHRLNISLIVCQIICWATSHGSKSFKLTVVRLLRSKNRMWLTLQDSLKFTK